VVSSADETSDASRSARLPREARRKQLLAAAQEVFVANGYHATGMDDIAERAGVSKPVLYQHFPGKLELYLALLDTQTDALIETLQGALSTTEDNAERVHAVLAAYFDFVDRAGNDGAYRLVFESDLVNDPAVRQRVERVTHNTVHAVAQTVAADTGLNETASELLATALIGAAEAAAKWWLDTDKPLEREDAIVFLEELLWRGISSFPLHEHQ
jgi:AcrR family transcriptional regulator